jgi:hypothetical protein
VPRRADRALGKLDEALASYRADLDIQIYRVDFADAAISNAQHDSANPNATFKSMDLIAEDVRQLGRFD